jgi:hypothetical protein
MLSTEKMTANHNSKFLVNCINNNSSFRLKHPGVPDGSDSSDGTLYPLTENQT